MRKREYQKREGEIRRQAENPLEFKMHVSASDRHYSGEREKRRGKRKKVEKSRDRRRFYKELLEVPLDGLHHFTKVRERT